MPNLDSEIPNTRKWTEKENVNFINFIKKEQHMLRKNFVDNLKGENSKKKSKGFFKKMSIFINSKNPIQCKSKFQKTERKIYITYLHISEHQYQELLTNRKNKSKKHSNQKKEIKLDPKLIVKPIPIRLMVLNSQLPAQLSDGLEEEKYFLNGEFINTKFSIDGTHENDDIFEDNEEPEQNSLSFDTQKFIQDFN